ncbi:MAG TPA: amidase [Bryobacteraceae bacterium]|nr:amidase [Bryobacteraceae bacterium]
MRSDVCDLSAVEMACLIRAGQLSARECVEAHLVRIEQVNREFNAIVTLTAETALNTAAAADERQARGEPLGPLHGLPVAHKDLQPTRGVRTTFGSRIFENFVPAFDSLVVERIRNAGGIALGKTNTPEFGAGSQTFNEVFGATCNPHDHSKTCGGSSGGSAVALSCGMVALADGSDLGGSLRNPASYCGVVGLRPSAGRVPSWPSVMPWSPLAVEGPMARSVEDLALFLSAIAGPDPRAPLSIDSQPEQFVGSLDRDFTGARVAWWKDLGGIPIDPEVRRITNASRRVFESLGAIVEEAEPEWEGADRAFRILRFWMSGARLSLLPPDRISLLKDTIQWEIEQSRALTSTDVAWAHMKHGEIFERMRQLMDRFDFFVLPVSQIPPFDVTQPWPKQIDGVRMDTYIDWMKSCYYITMTGCPAISVPFGRTSDGLPVGIQIVARHRDELGLLRLAHRFERALH